MTSSNPLEDLPPELLRIVLKHTLPHGLSFKFHMYTVQPGVHEWIILARPIDSNEDFVIVVPRKPAPPKRQYVGRIRRESRAPAPPPISKSTINQWSWHDMQWEMEFPKCRLETFACLARVNKRLWVEAKGPYCYSLILFPTD